ncbi:GNAT family N-acetyltransferase [Pollutibacter soli]|uniref:GNAT family N-acetyltransferase n=1 Tax=Pollutibacter soli TaxID=3034157 RepID=UPI003013D114
MPEITDYTAVHAKAFYDLNRKWLDQFNLTESHDLMILDDPQGTIIDRGGAIFVAVEKDEVIGTAAIIKEGDHGFELAKMTVAEAHRGKGISKMLIEKCIEKAKKLGADHLSLFSNHRLKEAIKLYEKYGFEHREVKDAPFETADISMILYL